MSGQTSSTEQNKAIVRRYQDIYNTNRLDELADVLSPDLISHNRMPGFPPGLEGLKMIQAYTLNAFPDLQVAIEDLLADGDKVIMRFTITGTHQGEFVGAPASGKSIHVTGISIFRLADGKIVEHWGEEDSLGWLQQIGAIPSMG